MVEKGSAIVALPALSGSFDSALCAPLRMTALVVRASGGVVGGGLGLIEVEEGELVAGEEAELHPAEEVVHEALGVADLFVAGPAGGLEAGVGELFAEDLEGDAVLEAEGGGGGEGVHEAGDGGAFLGHADEDFAGLAVGVEADGDVAFVAADARTCG